MVEVAPAISAGKASVGAGSPSAALGEGPQLNDRGVPSCLFRLPAPPPRSQRGELRKRCAQARKSTPPGGQGGPEPLPS
eukprot:5865539-Alexandrium_andersonii.AAC.1